MGNSRDNISYHFIIVHPFPKKVVFGCKNSHKSEIYRDILAVPDTPAIYNKVLASNPFTSQSLKLDVDGKVIYTEVGCARGEHSSIYLIVSNPESKSGNIGNYTSDRPFLWHWGE